MHVYKPNTTGESPPLLRVLVHLFSWGKITLLRTFWPLNGGIDIERQWVNESRHPVSHRMTTWVGFPPSQAEGLGNEGKTQIRDGYSDRLRVLVPQ